MGALTTLQCIHIIRLGHFGTPTLYPEPPHCIVLVRYTQKVSYVSQLFERKKKNTFQQHLQCRPFFFLGGGGSSGGLTQAMFRKELVNTGHQIYCTLSKIYSIVHFQKSEWI